MKLKFTFPTLLLALISCSNGKDSTNTNTDNFSVECFTGGGKSSVYDIIYISEDSAYREIGNHIEKEVFNWKPSTTEIDDLINNFEINHYKSIRSNENKGEVFDRGGTVITIQKNGKTYKLKNQDNSFINDKWLENFKAIKNKIIDYAASKNKITPIR